MNRDIESQIKKGKYLDALESLRIINNRGKKIETDILKLFLIECKRDEYIKELENIITKGKQDSELLFEFGKYYLDIDKRKAIKYIKRHVETGKANREQIFLLVKLYREIGKSSEAIAMIKLIECDKIEEIKELHNIGMMENLNLNIAKKLVAEAINKASVTFKNSGSIVEEIMEDIIDKKIFENSGKIRANSDSWIKLIEENKKLLNICEKLVKYYSTVKDHHNAMQYMEEILKLGANERFICDEVLKITQNIALGNSEKNNIIEILLRLSQYVTDKKIKNIFLNEAEILGCKTILKSKPRELEVTLTNKCNINCIMCRDTKDNVEVDNGVVEYLKTVMPYLEKIGWKGGEVFLYDGFKELMRLAFKFKVRQHIVTNGLLLTDDIIDMISDFNIDLKISIDAVDKNTYEKIRVGAKFNKLLQIMSKLQSHKEKNKNFDYGMMVVVMTLNYDKIDAIINFAIEYGFNSVRFNRCIPGLLNQDCLLNEYQATEALKRINNNIDKFSDRLRIEKDISLSTPYHNTEKFWGENFMHKFKNQRNRNKMNLSEQKKGLVGVDKLFCDKPFKNIAFNIDKSITFGCSCNIININNYKYSEIWNCTEMQFYRSEIIKCNKSVCQVLF